MVVLNWTKRSTSNLGKLGVLKDSCWSEWWEGANICFKIQQIYGSQGEDWVLLWKSASLAACVVKYNISRSKQHLGILYGGWHLQQYGTEGKSKIYGALIKGLVQLGSGNWPAFQEWQGEPTVSTHTAAHGISVENSKSPTKVDIRQSPPKKKSRRKHQSKTHCNYPKYAWAFHPVQSRSCPISSWMGITKYQTPILS